MKTVLITGSDGFIGKNLTHFLRLSKEYKLLTFEINDSEKDLEDRIRQADFIFHLAGVNRPKDPSEFERGNAQFTEHIISITKKSGNAPPLVITSSSQAALDNAYGISKKHAEESALEYREESGAIVYIFRLPNVFGKWSRPNYNSVVATFCNNVALGLPIQITDPEKMLHLVHIDDVIQSFFQALEGSLQLSPDCYYTMDRIFGVTLQELATIIQNFPTTRDTRNLPSMGNELTKLLYSTYLSYLPPNQFAYPLNMKHDNRGWLAEFVRTAEAGQIFVSITHPGVTRGNHWHHTKTEKFLVVQGEALIRFRQIDGQDVFDYRVDGDNLKVVDIPPGYTHSITNIGTIDIVTIFWASEPFNPDHPDTQSLEV